jgi:hypothetical protein
MTLVATTLIVQQNAKGTAVVAAQGRNAKKKKQVDIRKSSAEHNIWLNGKSCVEHSE